MPHTIPLHYGGQQSSIILIDVGRNLCVLMTVILRVFHRAKARDFSMNFDGFLTIERGASDWFHDDFFWSTNKINDYRTPLRHDFLMGSSFQSSFRSGQVAPFWCVFRVPLVHFLRVSTFRGPIRFAGQ
jgi:hypothetical protein